MKSMTGVIIVIVALLCAAGASAQSPSTTARVASWSTHDLCVAYSVHLLETPAEQALDTKWTAAINAQVKRRHHPCAKHARTYFQEAARWMLADQRKSWLARANAQAKQASQDHAQMQSQIDALRIELAQAWRAAEQAPAQGAPSLVPNNPTWQSRLNHAIASPAFQTGVRLMEQAGPHTLGNSTTSCSPDGMHNGGFNCTTH